MGFFDMLGSVFGGTPNQFQALGPDGKPITQVGQSGFQAQNAPQMDYGSAINQSMQNAQSNYGQQQNYIDMLRGAASGQAPSVAQEMLRQQTQQAQQNAASAVASQRGMNPGLAAKMIMDQQAKQGQMAAGQGSLMRAQEMTTARGQLGSALGQQGAQNLGMFGQAGGLNQGQNALNLGVQGINAQTAMGNAQQQTQGLGMNAGVAGQNAQLNSGLVGGLLGGLGGLGSLMGSGADGSAAAQAAAVTIAGGGKVPGHASVPGDSVKNDKVKALLSPGEVVLPRSIAGDPEKAAAFVRHLREKEGKEKGEQKPTLDHLHKRISHIEQMLCGGGRAGYAA